MVERAYRRDILDLIQPAQELVRDVILGDLSGIVREAGFRRDAARLDDYVDQIEQRFGNIRVRYQKRVGGSSATQAAKQAAVHTNRSNVVQVNRQVKSVVGIDTFQSEPWVESAANGWIRENVSLIKSIPDRYFDEVEQLILRNIRAGQRSEAIAAQIAQRFDVAENRARLIADDQVGKFFGQLTGRRHTELGFRRYRWRTSRDERVRGRPDGLYPNARHSHWDREGKIFREDRPPPDGHPGEPIRCRCFREPVFEDLLGPEFQVDQTPAPASSAASFITLSSPGGRRRRVRRHRSSRISEGQSLRVAEKSIQDASVEHLGVFVDDRSVFSAVGDADSVDMPPEMIREMRRSGASVISHNHPDGRPLSPEDIFVAVMSNAKELRAVSPNGDVFILRRPAAGWSLTSTELDRLDDTLKRVYNRGERRAHSRLKKRTAAMPADVATKELLDEIWEEIYESETLRAYNEWGASRGWVVLKRRRDG